MAADADRMAAYVAELARLWAAHPTAYIHEFEKASRHLHEPWHDGQVHSAACLDIFNVAPDGTAFWGNPELLPATETTLRGLRFDPTVVDPWAAVHQPAYRDFVVESRAGVHACRAKCAYFDSCRGGNPSHKYYETGRFDGTLHATCVLSHMPVRDALFALLGGPVSDAQHQQGQEYGGQDRHGGQQSADTARVPTPSFASPPPRTPLPTLEGGICACS